MLATAGTIPALHALTDARRRTPPDAPHLSPTGSRRHGPATRLPRRPLGHVVPAGPEAHVPSTSKPRPRYSPQIAL